jgi:hypothetical protein
MARISPGGKPVEFRPGRLMSDLSSDSVGLSNYTVKQDFRRVQMDKDDRAEGYEWYRPNTTSGSISKLLQSIPPNSTDPVTLISECVIGNGRIALVAGNSTTLWRYWGLEDPAYYDIETFYGNLIMSGSQYAVGQYVLSGLTPGNTYSLEFGTDELSVLNGTQVLGQGGNFVAQGASVALNQRIGAPTSVTATITNVTPVPQTYYDTEGGSTYYDDEPAAWIVIASGLNSSGTARRWEAVQVGDYLVLNNGADLPLTYNLQETQAYPIYELREQQIAAVGTIASHAGILCCADIYQITDQAFLNIMTPLPAAEQASQDVNGIVSPPAVLLFPTQATFQPTSVVTTSTVQLEPGPPSVSGIFTVSTATGLALGLNILVKDGAGNFISGPIIGLVGSQVTMTVNGRSLGATPMIGASLNTVSVAPLIGLTLFWSDGTQSKITGVNGAGNLTTTSTIAKSTQSVTLENSAAYALFDCTQDNSANFQRYPWRFFPSMPSLPRRFGATVPVSFTASPGYPDPQQGYGANVGTLLYPVKSIPELINSNQAANRTQTSFTISGIATGSGNLTTDIVWTYPKITQSIFLAQPAATSQPAFNTSTDLGAFIEAADALGSFAGVFEDLQDDDGAIIKMLTLRDQLVIYKETPVVFVASYTGDLTTPFQFQKVVIANASQALKYRNSLVAQGGGYFGSSHVYAGVSAFYKFDLYQMTPTELPPLETCQNTFFSNAQDPENCFGAENPLTQEIFFCFGLNTDGSDNALCYDYRYQTARTTQFPISSAARARDPVDRTYWFVMGMVDGSIKRYGRYDKAEVISGLVTATLAYVQGTGLWTVTASGSFFQSSHVGMTIEFPDGTRGAIQDCISATQVTLYFSPNCPTYTGFTTGQSFKLLPSMWHVDGAPFTSTLESGLESFGSVHMQKMLNEYVLVCKSESQNSSINVSFDGAQNPEKRQSGIQNATIERPDIHNLINPTIQEYYLGVTLAVTGMNDPIGITTQLFSVTPIDTHSFGRQS